MNKTELTANLVLAGGIILFITGVGHICLGVPQFNEAVSQGLINLLPLNQIDFESQSLGREEVKLVWIVFGLDMNIFGLITMFLTSELKKGKRLAWNIGIVIGLFYLIVGLTTMFYFKELHPAVVSFPIAGLIISIPLLVYRHEFNMI